MSISEPVIFRVWKSKEDMLKLYPESDPLRPVMSPEEYEARSIVPEYSPFIVEER